MKTIQQQAQPLTPTEVEALHKWERTLWHLSKETEVAFREHIADDANDVCKCVRCEAYETIDCAWTTLYRLRKAAREAVAS